jgi:hypothetical protein
MSAEYTEGILCVYTRRGGRGHFGEKPAHRAALGAKAVKPAHRIPANRIFHLPKPARGGKQALDLR